MKEQLEQALNRIAVLEEIVKIQTELLARVPDALEAPDKFSRLESSSLRFGIQNRLLPRVKDF